MVRAMLREEGRRGGGGGRWVHEACLYLCKMADAVDGGEKREGVGPVCRMAY